MHTYNLLTEHADRSTIAPAQLPLLDHFLLDQKALIRDDFRLLQATDNLSLLSCVDFRQPASSAPVAAPQWRTHCGASAILRSTAFCA
jgi:hypothetical protein